MRQVQVHGGATSKARASHEPFKEATEASAWGKAGVATGAAPGGLPGGVLGKESGVARGRFTCSLSEDLRPAANRGAIASSGPKVAAVDIASRHRGGEGLGLDYEVADAHKMDSSHTRFFPLHSCSHPAVHPGVSLGRTRAGCCSVEHPAAH
jgi:hypothetical protein